MEQSLIKKQDGNFANTGLGAVPSKEEFEAFTSPSENPDSAYIRHAYYDKLVKINKLLRELLRDHEADLKNLESKCGVWRVPNDGPGNYR